MLKELSIFLVLWLIQLFIFACIGELVFGSLKQYDSFFDVIILLFQSSLGQWDLTIYDDFVMGKYVG
jgi:hypothetical protein